MDISLFTGKVLIIREEFQLFVFHDYTVYGFVLNSNLLHVGLFIFRFYYIAKK